MAKFTIYYAKPEFSRDFCCGLDSAEEWTPDVVAAMKHDLTATHTELLTVQAPTLGHVYSIMQGENWSRDGVQQAAAQALIRAKGLKHTSMSVGDIAVDSEGVAHMVDMIGWKSFDDWAATVDSRSGMVSESEAYRFADQVCNALGL